MTYFKDVDIGNIVRKPDEGMHLEYSFKGACGWLKTEPKSSYEREYWLGEGRCCLFNITEEEAMKEIASWNEFLIERQILIARECYLYRDDTLYISIHDDSDLFVYHLKSKSWTKRESCSFWDSWDSAPYLLVPISNEEAVKLISSL